MFEVVLTNSSRNILLNLNDELNRLKFYLGGGSGLALQLGHRISEDLDFFTNEKFQPEILANYLATKFRYEETMVSEGTLYCLLNEVKVSFIYYPISCLYPPIEFHKIKVADWRDLIAEKFKTLSQRGSKRDFYDIYFGYTLGNLTISDGIAILKKRFAGTGINYYHILKSLVYFEDADKEPELILLKPVAWETVKNFFRQNLYEFERYLLTED
ncbi:MAG: nucleotidyl transferase AbiEii/AbiGii toxin family protein [candidate division WOR-3 bacterium]